MCMEFFFSSNKRGLEENKKTKGREIKSTKKGKKIRSCMGSKVLENDKKVSATIVKICAGSFKKSKDCGQKKQEHVYFCCR
jgi:hypothetical protein